MIAVPHRIVAQRLSGDPRLPDADRLSVPLAARGPFGGSTDPGFTVAFGRSADVRLGLGSGRDRCL
jgi:hypothetical protein